MRKIVALGVATAAAVGFVVGTGLPRSARAGTPAIVPSIFTANANANTVSALGGPSLAHAFSDVPVGVGPRAIALSHDATTVYTGNHGSVAGTISLFSASTGGGVQTFTVALADIVTDIAVAPDDSVVYATIRNSGKVKVFNTTSHTVTDTFSLPTISTNSPDPESIDAAPDGQSIFVLNVRDARVEKMKTIDGDELAHATVNSTAFRLKLSGDGGTLIVLDDGAPKFLATDALAPVLGAATADLGTPVDVAVAGSEVFVLNSSYAGPVVAPGGGFVPVVGQPSIDVYDASTGAYVHSIGLGAGDGVVAIAVDTLGATAWFSRTGAENPGTVTQVDLTSGTIGATGSTGADPVRIAVNEKEATPVVAYFLPRKVALVLGGPGKDSLVASGFFDDGGLTVDYTQPITVEVDDYQQTFTLLPNAAHTAYKFTSSDKTLKFTLVPNLKGSSLGKFTMKVTKATLANLVDVNQPVQFHFHATGLADAKGQITLTQNRYRLGGKRGSLTLPQFFPAKAVAKLAGPNQDSLSFKGGFATNGTTPGALSTVLFAFGPSYAREIPGNSFTKNGDVFTYSDKIGAAKFKIVLNFLRETVTVSASKIELGDLSGKTVDVVLDAGNGAGAYRNTVRLGVKGSTKAY